MAFDKFHEECWVFGVYGHPEAANLAYLGLYALQHRGQEGAGDLSSGDWVRLRAEKEATIIEHAHPGNVFYVVFDPGSILMPPSYKVTAYCLLHRVMKKEETERPYRVSNLWRCYATESFYEPSLAIS